LQPNLDIKKALHRRDLTMNAMAINLTQMVAEQCETIAVEEIIDPFGGLADCQSRTLRAVDDAFFVQDPLRLLRVMQFIGRFEMVTAPELDALCAQMPLYDTYDNRPLARERIQAELVKLLTRAQRPSLGFAWLVKIGRATELFPQLALNETTLHLLDRVASCLRDADEEDCLIMLFTVLCYASTGQVRVALHNCTSSQKCIVAVEAILHILPQCKQLASDEHPIVTCKKIAAHVAVHSNLELISIVAWQLFEPTCARVEQTALYRFAQQAAVLYGPEHAIVLGRDLLDQVQPGPQIGALVAAAYEIQITQGLTNKQQLIDRVLDRDRR
jgi:tRNA nucleotidyltransferase (CCA-adding enzyme)